MDRCTLVIEDNVNVRFRGVDPFLRKKIVDALKKFVPHARHTPAYKLGRWDGTKSFATAGGGTYINLLDQVLPMIMEKYEIDIEDRRPNFNFQFPTIGPDYLSYATWPEGHDKAGEPVMLRDYQYEAINRYLANPQSIQCISTGAGKTLLTAALSKITEAYGRSIVIVPSKSLVEQTEEDYRNLGLDVGVFYGDRKEYGHRHTICTWQSLVSLTKKTKKGGDLPITIHDFAKDVVCIQIDEAHTIKGEELKEILCGPLAHIPLRWGLTGTVPKEDWEFWCLLASVGPVIGEIRADFLQEQGVLSKCDVEVLEFDDGDLAFADYREEYEFLVTDKVRLQKIADMIIAWSEKGNTLFLVDRVETGKTLTDMIPGATFVYGDTKSQDRKKEYKSVATSDDRVIIATYGVAAVGINIPRLFTVGLLEGGKSFVRIIQSIGRGLRKAHDKDFVDIKDVCSTLKFSKRHRSKRIGYYNDAGYPNRTTKVHYR